MNGAAVATVVPGLCSVTLRATSIEDVARLAGECGLRAIEWGGDVHVPPGDRAAAWRARDAGAAAGVKVVSYGSYLLAAWPIASDAIEVALDTAVELGATNVRIWTPLGDNPDSARRSAITDAVRSIAIAAAARALTVGIEYHGGTLTATAASTIALLDAVDAPNVFTYWQPSYWIPPRIVADDVADLGALAARVSHVHVYEWADATHRLPLADGEARWTAVLAALAATPSPLPTPRAALLEFVVHDDPDALRADAKMLVRLLEDGAP